MKNNNPRILVLGASGMTGRTVFRYLGREFPTVIGTVRKKPGKNEIKFIFSGKHSLNKLFRDSQFNYVINCIGILKNKSKDYSLNYILPKSLESLSSSKKFKIINISSDDVYDPLSEGANEKTPAKPNNPYGKSKLKGEIISKNVINVRTSLIGFDPIEKKGLIEWLMKNQENEVQGYINQIWSGCTTLQFAKLCKYLIGGNFITLRKKTPTVNFTPLGPVTKFELLKSISKSLNLKVKINEKETDEIIKRFLTSSYFDKKFLQRYTTENNKAMKELVKFDSE